MWISLQISLAEHMQQGTIWWKAAWDINTWDCWPFTHTKNLISLQQYSCMM